MNVVISVRVGSFMLVRAFDVEKISYLGIDARVVLEVGKKRRTVAVTYFEIFKSNILINSNVLEFNLCNQVIIYYLW